MIEAIMTKECPMCNELMRVRLAERVDTIPGTQQTIRREYRECRDSRGGRSLWWRRWRRDDQ